MPCRSRLLAAVTVAVLAAGAAGCSDSGSEAVADPTPTTRATPPPAPPPTPSEPVAAPAGGEVVPEEVDAVLAGAVHDPDGAMADQTRQELGSGATAIPPGASLTVHENTWVPDPTGEGGTVNVTLSAPGRPDVHYTAVMVLEGQEWKILATFPAAKATP